MNTIIETGLNLLDVLSLSLSEYPGIIEQLEIAAHDTGDHITALHDRASYREELATKEAIEEPNESSRKAARAEFLRSDGTYREIKTETREAERVRVQLTERAARLRREYRYGLLQLELSALRLRA